MLGLLVVLDAEVSTLEQLVACVQSEVDLLLTHEHRGLAELLERKSELLAEVERNRVRRERAVADHCRHHGVGEATLSALVEALDSPEGPKLLRRRIELLRLVSRLRTLNTSGRRHTRRHLRFVRTSKRALSGDSTYGAGEYGPGGHTRHAPTRGIALNARV